MEKATGTDIVPEKQKQEVLLIAGKSMMEVLRDTPRKKIKPMVVDGLSSMEEIQKLKEQNVSVLLTAKSVLAVIGKETKELAQIELESLKKQKNEIDTFFKANEFSVKFHDANRGCTETQKGLTSEIESELNRLKRLVGNYDAEQIRKFEAEKLKRELEAAREKQKLEEQKAKMAEKIRKAGEEERAKEIEEEEVFVPIVEPPTPEMKTSKKVWSHQVANLSIFLNALINGQFPGMDPESCIEIKPGAVNTWLRQHEIEPGLTRGLRVSVERIAK